MTNHSAPRSSGRLSVLGRDAVYSLAVLVFSLMAGMILGPWLYASQKPADPLATDSKDVDVRLISLEELESLLAGEGRDTVRIVDVREPLFYRRGHIPGAVNHPRKKMEQWQDAFIAECVQEQHPSKIIFYCTDASCEDSAWVATRLVAQIQQQILIYKGGWREWERKHPPK